MVLLQNWNGTILKLHTIQPFMKILDIFFTLLLFCLCSLALTAQNSITTTLKVANYTLHYELSPIGGNKYKFTVKNIANANTDAANFSLVYASQAQVFMNGSQLKEVRIYAAKNSTSNAINWNISLTDCLRLLFDKTQPTVANLQTAGKLLDPYLVGTLPTNLTFAKNPTEKEVLQAAAKQFIESYYKIMSIEKSKTANTALTGNVQTETNGTYQYEIGQGAAANDKEFYVRQGEKGLLLRTILRIIEDDKKLIIRILYAKQKDFSWEIYGSDFWEMTLDKNTQQPTAQKEGLFLPPLLTGQQQAPTTPYTNSAEGLQKLAAEWFIQTYQGRVL